MHSIKARFLRKRYVIPSIGAVVALAGTGVAYAYFTSTGSGTASAQVGTASNWVIKTAGPSAINTSYLYPDPTIGGTNVQTIGYTVTNPGKGDQNLTSVRISVANSDGSAWSVQTNPNDPPCEASDFSINGGAVGVPEVDTSLAGTYTPGQTRTGSVTIEMIDNGHNQDNCQGVKVPLYFSVGNPDLSIDTPPPSGSGGFYPNPEFLPVPSIPENTAATLVVTAIQPGPENASGTITLSWDNTALTFTGTSGDGTCGTITSSGDSSTVSCSFTDLSHSDTSKPFYFTTLAPGQTFVNAFVSIPGSGTASETFPLMITG